MTNLVNNIIHNAKIITEDGEIFEGTGVLNPERKIIRDLDYVEQQKRYFAEKKNYEAFTDLVGSFTFMLADTITALHKDTRFTDTEKARIIFLGTYCSYESSGRYLKFANNVPILKSHLQNLLELANNKQFYEFYNKLIANGIITEETVSSREVRLKWSSEYHFKGMAKGSGVKSTELIKAYDKQVQALFKEKDEDGRSVNVPKTLYTLFMMLPFIHFESGTLCKKPLADISECEPFELKELAEMFGFSRANILKSRLLNYKLYGTNVFFIGSGIKNRKKYTRVFVNPFIASRNSKVPNETLLNMFPDTAKALYEKYRIK